MSAEETKSQVESGGTELVTPSAAELLETVLELGREVHLEMDEDAMVQRFVDTLGDLFPGRHVCVRVSDPRSTDHARSYGNTELRPGIESERLRFKQSSIEKTRLKTAIAHSARIKVGGRWDSPFPHVAHGFAVPLVASGELYGCLDVGYPLEHDLSDADEPLVLPIANHLSVALRNERLHKDTLVLRDYQSKLIEHANALILGVDRHWRITVANQALCRLTGYDRDDVIGRDLRDWLPEEQRPRLTKLFLHALTGGPNQDAVEVTLLTKSGHEVKTAWSVAAIGARRNIEAVVAIGQDQTRLRDLQSQVIQAEKLATLGQLAAGVVHELNNPLTSITVYAEYLLKKAERAVADDGVEGPEPGDVEKLRRIRAGAQRILDFAKDLVQYAKPAGDELDVISVNQVVQQSLSFCEHLFDRSHVALEESLAGDLPTTYAVPGQLEQVLINLVTNAVQASGEGGWVKVSTFRADVGKIGVEVSDSGPGIAQGDRQRIFEPFFTTKVDGKGTGLGLSIVRNIVEQHQGEITVDEADGGGARFRIVLPATG